MARQRIAIWIHGGVGSGMFSQGQPCVQTLIERLSTQYDVEVFTALPPNREFKPNGFKLHYLTRRALPSFLVWPTLMAMFIRRHFGRRYRVVYAFWGYPAGIVAVLLGKLLRIPSVVHLQGGDATALPRLGYGVFARPVRAAICRIAYNRCTRLIALTRFQAECLMKNNVKKVPLVIPFGPDTEVFTFAAKRFSGQTTQLLHVGNLTPVKGQDLMLQVFARVARQVAARLTIVGGDYSSGRVKEWCRSLDIEEKVTFHEPKPHAHMVPFYHHADILLHTSWYEGQGLVIAEACACGTLIAGTNVGMTADLGKNCALIAEPGEIDLLAGKIVDLIKRRDYYNMQSQARRWVEEKDVNYTERRVIETINQILHVAPQGHKTSTVHAQG